VLKRHWTEFVLEDSSGRRYNYKNDIYTYTREMRKIMETGEVTKFFFPNIPEQKDICHKAWMEPVATIDWEGMMPGTIERLFRGLERVEELGDRELEDVLHEFRGIIASPLTASRHRFRLVDGAVVQYSPIYEQWRLLTKERQRAER